MKWNTHSPIDRQCFAPEDVFKAGIAQHHISNTAYPIGHLTTMRPIKFCGSRSIHSRRKRGMVLMN